MHYIPNGPRTLSDQKLITELLNLYPKILTKLEDLLMVFYKQGVDLETQNDLLYAKLKETINFIEDEIKIIEDYDE